MSWTAAASKMLVLEQAETERAAIKFQSLKCYGVRDERYRNVVTPSHRKLSRADAVEEEA